MNQRRFAVIGKKIVGSVLVAGMLTACSGGGSDPLLDTPRPTNTPISSQTALPTQTSTPLTSATPTPSLTQTPTPTLGPGQVIVSGTVTYDFVPNNDSNGGLDYNLTEQRAVRGATVVALTVTGSEITSTSTDNAGSYSLFLDENINVRIRVEAKMERQGSPSWDISVTDNTSGNALYTMDGSVANVGSSNSVRDLHADSGWGGSSYSSTRVAAPFAILDTVYEAMQLVLSAEPNVNFTQTELRWSTENLPVGGTRSNGEIGTSFYDPTTGEKNMYILGAENNDTDEYDRSVIIHEWGHYLEDTLARSDSLGGSHTLSSILDMRLAFGEGFANAFAAIVSGQPFYADSGFTSQSSGFRFSLEENDTTNAGWFSENSVGKIVYDIADSNDDGEDRISLGFTPIYQALTSADYVNGSAFTSIYSFISSIKNITDTATDEAIDDIVVSEGISGDDAYGANESNDSAANITFALPVYHTLSLGQTVNVCGNNSQGEYNGLDVRRFIRVDVPSFGNYTIRASKTLGVGDRDPDMFVYRAGQDVGRLDSGAVDSEEGLLDLQAGEHIIEIFDYLNTDDIDGGGSSCFDVTIFEA